MTTTPGYSGGKFQKEQFSNIMRFRFMYPKVPLIVDGGVTAEISSVLTFMGIPQVVSGSYLFSAETVFETVSKLRDKPIVKWTVSDISLSEPELLQGFSLRLPETVPFINQNAQFETIDLPDHWLNAVGGKSVAMQFGPFPIVWVDDRIDADSFRIQLTILKEQPHLAITVNENNDVSGFICLTNFN
jgi:hypothetical protein